MRSTLPMASSDSMELFRLLNRLEDRTADVTVALVDLFKKLDEMTGVIGVCSDEKLDALRVACDALAEVRELKRWADRMDQKNDSTH